MTKLIEGKLYKITFPNGDSIEVTYGGTAAPFNHICDGCRKERWNAHSFVVGDVNNPTTQYFYGSECIKKIKIEEVI